MTVSANDTFEKETPAVDRLTDSKSLADLEDIFTLGYVKSDPIVVFEDESKNLHIEVVYRTLTPTELVEVFEEVGRCATSFAQQVTEKIETLARAIQYINKSPLVLSAADNQHYCQKFEVESLTPLTQARIILKTKVKSVEVINALWEKYQEFKNAVVLDLDSIKKK